MPRVGAKHVSFTRWKSVNVCLVLCIVVGGWRVDGRFSTSSTAFILEGSTRVEQEAYMTMCDCVRDEQTQCDRVRMPRCHCWELQQVNQQLQNATIAGAENAECKHQMCTCCVKNCNDDSIGASSAAESGVSDSLSTTQCLQSKLLATMQILQNKEETIRLQAQSLAIAEARISELRTRSELMKRQLNQFQSSPTSVSSNIDKTDVSITTDFHEDLYQKKIMNTLQDNLSIIEELYRECFYETAKQEELMDKLRQSCIDVRTMEKEKSDHIGRLQNVVNTQKWSLDKCQDIAMEVESLKSEISHFLNSSNNDSGMWERSEESFANELGDDLRHISAQLLQLRELITDDCTCGLQEENIRLRQINNSLETEAKEFRQRIRSLETAFEEKDDAERRLQQTIDIKEQEFRRIRLELVSIKNESVEKKDNCDTLTRKLEELNVLLREKSLELSKVQQQCQQQETTIAELRVQLKKAELVKKEEKSVRSEVSQLSAEVGAWRAQLVESRRRLHALQDELGRAREYCRDLTEQYTAKARQAVELRGELAEAQARGAALCGEARGVVCGVRNWLRKHRQHQREQEEKLKNQEALIQRLQQRIDREPGGLMRSGENEPCCSRYIAREESRRNDYSPMNINPRCNCDRFAVIDGGTYRKIEETSCSRCRSTLEQRGQNSIPTRGSEIDSCVSTPKPPRRMPRKKKLFCTDDHSQQLVREVGLQQPLRSDASTSTAAATPTHHYHSDRSELTISPTEELVERVERAHEALASAHRRWLRTASAHSTHQ